MHGRHDRTRDVTNPVGKGLAVLLLGILPLIGACSDPADRTNSRESGATAGSETSIPPASVHIAAPREGEVVEGAEVLVVLDVEGLVVVPAGVQQASSGHHHLLVDAPLPELDMPIPSEPGRYIHLGKGQTEYRLEGLESGEHRVIALVGDHAHVPLNPPVADTVDFFVP